MISPLATASGALQPTDNDRRLTAMMWLVRVALQLPYTFVALAALIAILGVALSVTMPTDIFSAFNISVVSVVWN